MQKRLDSGPVISSEGAVNILVVDDDPGSLHVLSSCLRDPEMKVVKASSGEEALALLARLDIGIALLDVHLPGMSGIDVARQMKSVAETSLIPIIFITGSNDVVSEEKGYEEGGADYLSKPVNTKALLAKVRHFIRLIRDRQRIEALNLELESLVASRSASLQSELAHRKVVDQRLIQIQKMEALGELSGGLAHDLNNLLAIILGSAQMARDPKLPEETLEDLHVIIEACERACGLTGQLMSLSRMPEECPQLIDLGQVVQKLEGLLGRTLKGDIHFSTVVDAEPCSVFADIGQMEQILMNLTVNAGESIAESTVENRVLIRCQTIELKEARRLRPEGALPAGKWVQLMVEDTGSGIPPSQLTSIFEAGYSTREKDRVCGLGLATVRAIVASSQGLVDVDSEVGRGTRFSVFLPYHARTESRQTSHAANPVSHDGKTILLVEDERDIRELCARKLSRLGYQVITASDGKEALDLFQQNEDAISMLVSDILMPRMDGAELAQKVIEQKPQTPLLFISGYTGDRITEHLDKEQSFTFLRKPFELEELAKCIRDCLDE